jgi:CRISPR-associated endonuclease/helicase Cas3
MKNEYYAHSLDGKPPKDWQPLEEHLKNVAEMARSFATAFGAGEWGYLAGLWHDVGKYSTNQQIPLYIISVEGRLQEKWHKLECVGDV